MHSHASVTAPGERRLLDACNPAWWEIYDLATKWVTSREAALLADAYESARSGTAWSFDIKGFEPELAHLGVAATEYEAVLVRLMEFYGSEPESGLRLCRGVFPAAVPYPTLVELTTEEVAVRFALGLTPIGISTDITYADGVLMEPDRFSEHDWGHFRSRAEHILSRHDYPGAITGWARDKVFANTSFLERLRGDSFLHRLAWDFCFVVLHERGATRVTADSYKPYENRQDWHSALSFVLRDESVSARYSETELAYVSTLVHVDVYGRVVDTHKPFRREIEEPVYNLALGSTFSRTNFDLGRKPRRRGP